MLPESLYWEHLVAGKLRGAERRPWAKWGRSGKETVEPRGYPASPSFSIVLSVFPPQLLQRRFSALEHGIHPPPAQSKIEELETEMEQETEPEPEPELEPQLEPEPRQL